MKKVLIYFLIVLVFSILWIITNALMPFSQTFTDINAETSPLAAIFMFICSAFICFAICFIVSNSNWRGMKRVAGISFAVFMINSFMMQIETMFFGSAFPALTRIDALLIMFSALPSILVGTILSVKFFGNKDTAEKRRRIPVSTLVPRIMIIGPIYMIIYILFGYFVLWQFEEARLFYEFLGNIEGFTFIGTLMIIPPFTYFFQFVRGIMFALFVLPIFYMLQEKGRKNFIISVCLIYFTTPVLLIVPNPLFPDVVRWAHFIEMSLSMLVFGIIVGNIMWKKQKTST